MMKRKKKQFLIIAVLLVLLIASTAVLLYVRHGGNAGSKAENKITVQDDSAGKEDTAQSDEISGDGNSADQPLETLFFASDYQAEKGWDDPADNLSAILGSAKDSGASVDMAVICGDYTNDRLLHDYQLSPDKSIERIREVIEAEYTEITDDEILIVQGNHDRMTDQISESGLHEYEDCLIYVLNTQEDFPWKQGKTNGSLSRVKKSSEDMKACFDSLIRNGETRPVFIAGHVPLHFTARTSSRHTTGDNLYASLIFDVVNDAAESLDIVYLFGHNHSKGWDCYMGGSSVYKAPGESILIPEFDENSITTDDYSKETLNFTYLNAGYTGYYMNCGPDELERGLADEYSAADETLTGTVFEVYDDRIIASRYDSNGVHVLGHEGEANPYKGGIDKGLIPEAEYSKETRSPQETSRKNS